MIEFEDKSCQELILATSYSDLDVTDLNVIDKREVDTPYGKIEYGILGASHYVKRHMGDKILSEVFSCKELEFSNNVSYYPIDGLDKLHITKEVNHRKKFEFKCDIHSFKKDGYVDNYVSNLLQRAEARPNDHMIFEFPYDGFGEPDFSPITLISCYGTVVETVHAYPNENKVVLTKSFIY